MPLTKTPAPQSIADALDTVVGMMACAYVALGPNGQPVLRCEVLYPDGSRGVVEGADVPAPLAAAARNYLNVAGKTMSIKKAAGWT